MAKAPADSRIPVGGRIPMPKAAKGAVRRTLQNGFSAGSRLLPSKIKLPILKPINRLVDMNKKHNDDYNDNHRNEMAINSTYDKIPDITNAPQNITFTMCDKADPEKTCNALPELNNKTFDLGENILEKVLEAKEKDDAREHGCDVLLKDYEIAKLAENIGNKVTTITSNNPKCVNTVTGTLRYVGHVRDCDDVWCGIETDRPAFEFHDGSINGLNYFRCKMGYGLMVPATYVVLQCQNQSIPDPKILELRKKLQNIKSKSNKSLDENRRPNVIDITQRLLDDTRDENQCDSGPYSLLMGFNNTNIKSEYQLRIKVEVDDQSYKELKQKRSSSDSLSNCPVAKKSNIELPNIYQRHDGMSLIEDESMPEFSSINSEFIMELDKQRGARTKTAPANDINKLLEEVRVNEKTPNKLCGVFSPSFNSPSSNLNDTVIEVNDGASMIEAESMPELLSLNTSSILDSTKVSLSTNDNSVTVKPNTNTNSGHGVWSNAKFNKNIFIQNNESVPLIEDECAPDFPSFGFDSSIDLAQYDKCNRSIIFGRRIDDCTFDTPPTNLHFDCEKSTPYFVDDDRELTKIIIDESTGNPCEKSKNDSSADNCIDDTENNCTTRESLTNDESESKKSAMLNLPSPTVSDNSIQELSKQNSFDESLGILTPEQMNSLSFLENVFSPSSEDFVGLLGSDKNTEKTESSSPQTPTEIMKSLTPDGVQALLNPENDVSSNITVVPEVDISIDNQTAESTVIPEETELGLGNTSNQSLADNNDSYELFVQRPFKHSTAENLQTCKELFSSAASHGVDDELLPSVHSSILDAFSSIVDTRFDNIQHVRVDQTPSPEELPLDPIDIKSDHCPLSTDPKTDPSKSVTYSITSIISLDGYQGDGEMSRPVSRGADQSPTIGHRIVNNIQNWQNIPISRRPDPMTDSDFFTESDADGHDEHVHRGDRKAQVIDGALYGGGKGTNPPVIVSRNGNSNDDSCMESSGVFTDMETHRCSPLLLNVIDDLSPEGSSPSTRSDLSQNNNSEMYHAGFNSSLNSTIVAGTTGNKLDQGDNKNKSPDLNKSSFSGGKNDQSGISTPNTSNDKMNKEDKNMALKKYKMPRRDVASKVKTLLNASSNKSLDTQEKSTAPKKEGRWDAVMNKISVNKTESKSKSYLKDIKSKINSSQSFEKSSLCEDNSLSSNSKPKAKTSASKLKTRRVKSSRMPKINMMGNSNHSTPHSSQSDLSVSCSAPPKINSAKHTTTRAAKKRDVAGGPGRPLSPPTNVPANTPAHVPNPSLGSGPAQQYAPSRNRTPPAANGRPGTLVKKPSGISLTGGPPATSVVNVPASKGPVPSRKPIARRAATQLSPRVQPLKDQNRATSPANVLKVPPRASATPPAPTVCIPPPPPPAKDVEALAVLVQYLVFQLDAFNAHRWKAQATQAKTQLAEANGRLQRAISAQRAEQSQLIQSTKRIADLEDELNRKDVDFTNRFINTTTAAESKYKEAIQSSQSITTEISNLRQTLEVLKRDVGKCNERTKQAEKSSHHYKSENSAYKIELKKLNDEALMLKNLTITQKNALIAKEHEIELYRIAQQQEAKEISVVRQTSEDVCGVASKVKLNESKMAAEIESLKSVLDMKMADMADLRKKCEEYQTYSEQLPLALQRAATLADQNEELRLQINQKVQEELTLTQQLKHLQETYIMESHSKNKLLQQNEELKYKLQKKSIVTNYLAAMRQDPGNNGNFSVSTDSPITNQTYPGEKFIRGQGRTASFNDRFTNVRDRRHREWLNSSKNNSDISNNCNGSMDSFTCDDLSPPNSPKIKGVVEKTASVSYVLEIEDSPEEIANRLVRCGSSNRMSTSLPAREAVKRQRSKQNSCNQLSLPNPLAQSASASCIDPLALRSGSTQRKLFRSNSVENQKFGKTVPKNTSTPNKKYSPTSSHRSNPSPASDCSTNRNDDIKNGEFNDLENQTLTNMSSNLDSDINGGDLVLLNKCEHVPKESGGEALISGTNSEDDSSLDEPLHSSSDCDSGSECDKYIRSNGAGERLADPALQKIAESLNNTLSATPMDVSWSEDCVIGVSDSDI